MMELRNKRVLVLGLGESSRGVIRLLKDKGALISLSSLSSPSQEDKEILEGVKDKEFGKHSRDFLEGKDLVVVSPGIKEEAPPIIWAREKGLNVITDIELAYHFCKGKIIAVTGTNGKTTTVSYLYQILKNEGLGVHLGGNIGTPFSSIVGDIKEQDFVCLEVSSFQLKRVNEFKPFIAIFLNIQEDHLDWHPDFSDYLESKWNIFKNQDQHCFSLINKAYPILSEKAKYLSSKVLFFKEEEDWNENISACIKCSEILGMKKEKVLGRIKDSPPLEHRIEFVGIFGGKKIYNDSKATNISSTIFCLRSLKEKITLICGGRSKNQNFDSLKDNKIFNDYVEEIIVIGESKNKIISSLRGRKKIMEARNLEEAVKISMAGAPKTVVLSPMCASLDMFKDYKERGVIFKKIVSSYGN